MRVVWWRTVNGCLERLSANFAVQVSDSGFLVDGYDDGVLVVAEEALECGWEFASALLHVNRVNLSHATEVYTFLGAPGFFAAFLRLPYQQVSICAS